MRDPSVLERLAEAEHERWSSQTMIMLKVLFPRLFDGTSQAALPHPKVREWMARAACPYRYLTEHEKGRYRALAETMLDVAANVVPDREGDVRLFMRVAGQTTPEVLSMPKASPEVAGAMEHALSMAFETYDDLVAGLEDTPHTEADRLVMLRARLIMEETRETLAALVAGEAAAFADGLADLQYVTIGAGLACGIPGDAVWRIVQRHNMDKFQRCGSSEHGEGCACGGTGYIVLRDAGGKIQKPQGWEPPDREIEALLAGEPPVGES